MRPFWIGILVLSAAQASAAQAQESPDVNVFSFGDVSCAAWVRSRGDESVRSVYGTWFRGFVSGYNFGNSANQVPLDRMPDPPALYAYIDRYCGDNPQLTFIGAAIPLVQSLREYRTPNPPPKPVSD
jgi:hypothetical protein